MTRTIHATSAARGASRPAGKARLPAHVGLQLARLVDAAPAGDGWLHEVKIDGYRALAWREGAQVRITSRGGQDWTGKLPAVAAAIARLPCRSCIVDGELITLDAQGRSSFGLLQQRFGEAGGKSQLRLVLFDVLYLDGEDLRRRPQLERKQRLAALLGKARLPLQLSEYVLGNGARVASEACAQQLEGIVSKRVDAPYEDGRGGAWVKFKCVQSDEYAIIGYTRGKGARSKLGSLLLATPTSGGGWRYRGRVGTGMDERMIDDLLRELSRSQSAPPRALQSAPTRAQLRGATPIWVAPAQVVEVEFRGYTEDGLLRQASLKGVRKDRSVDSLRPSQRDAAEVRAPVSTAAGARTPPARRRGRRAAQRPSAPEPGLADGSADRASGERPVRLTHPDRLVFEKPRITKQQLADFYRSISAHILPGLIARPLLLLRCPQGGARPCFFQKHLNRTSPPQLREVTDRSSGERWMYVDGLEGLLALVQMNALEYHVWGCTVRDLGHADRLVIDLDPGSGVPWKWMIEAAVTLRERLARLDLECFVRTSGSKGLHLVIPLQPPAEWEPAKSFVRSLAESMAREQPERYLSVASKAQRRGRIFIDYLRNARGATAVCSYSLRNRAGAPLATPLRWEELARVRAADQFRFDNIQRRLQRLSADPWSGIERVRQALPAR